MVLKTIKFKAATAATVVTFALALAAAPAPSAKAATCVQMYLAWGSSGQCVRYIQDMLNLEGNWFKWPLWNKLTVDGQFGPLTHNQVMAFQGFNNITKDGIVGPITWNKLCERAVQINNAAPFLLSTIALVEDARAVGCWQFQ